MIDLDQGLDYIGGLIFDYDRKKGELLMIDVMVKKNGKQVKIDPYKWVSAKDGLPAAPNDPDNPRVFYVRLDGGRPETAYYKGAMLEKWISLDNDHIVLNENDIIAWRYQRPR